MSRFCVVEGTKITLNDKETIPIERIKVGQEVLSFDLNTLQKSQKYDILVKMKTNQFDGVFQEDLVKNVWKNTVDEYYLINDKLKITKDHIVLVKRNNMYYWTKVEQLLLNDYLFTELNIFEKISSIIIVKEPVKVFNLEVNRVFNYFANSYLIHNGAPCSACLACGNEFYFFGNSSPATVAYNSLSYYGGDTSNVPSISIFQVPVGFNKVHFEIYGADGGLNNSSVTSGGNSQDDHGRGAYIRGHFKIRDDAFDTSDVYLHIGVGETWEEVSDTDSSYTTFNGGGAGSNRTDNSQSDGYNGGGATHIAFSSDTSLNSLINLEDLNSNKNNIVVIAGGGGGSSFRSEQTSSDSRGGNAGASTTSNTSSPAGKGYTGSDGIDGPPSYARIAGHGGTSSAGGTGGNSLWESDDGGTDFNGGFGEGGWRQTSGVNAHKRKQTPPGDSDGSAWQGGGGGGGWYGGGSGSSAGGGGGGGSSFIKGTTITTDEPTKISVTASDGHYVGIEEIANREGDVKNTTPRSSHTSGSNMENSDRRGSGFVKLILGNYS